MKGIPICNGQQVINQSDNILETRLTTREKTIQKMKKLFW